MFKSFKFEGNFNFQHLWIQSFEVITSMDISEKIGAIKINYVFTLAKAQLLAKTTSILEFQIHSPPLVPNIFN